MKTFPRPIPVIVNGIDSNEKTDNSKQAIKIAYEMTGVSPEDAEVAIDSISKSFFFDVRVGEN